MSIEWINIFSGNPENAHIVYNLHFTKLNIMLFLDYLWV